VQRCVGSPSPDTSCEVLPLSSLYGFPIDVVNPVAPMGRRKIVKEVYPIEGMHLLHVHGCSGERGIVCVITAVQVRSAML